MSAEGAGVRRLIDSLGEIQEQAVEYTIARRYIHWWLGLLRPVQLEKNALFNLTRVGPVVPPGDFNFRALC